MVFSFARVYILPMQSLQRIDQKRYVSNAIIMYFIVIQELGNSFNGTPYHYSDFFKLNQLLFEYELSLVDKIIRCTIATVV